MGRQTRGERADLLDMAAQEVAFCAESELGVDELQRLFLAVRRHPVPVFNLVDGYLWEDFLPGAHGGDECSRESRI